MLFLPSNGWVWTLSPFSTNSPLVSFLWLSLSLFVVRCFSTGSTFAGTGFQIGKTEEFAGHSSHGQGAQQGLPVLTFYFIHKQTMPVWLQGNPKEKLDATLGAGRKMFCIPLADVYNGNDRIYNIYSLWSDGSMDYRIPWKHLVGMGPGAPT